MRARRAVVSFILRAWFERVWLLISNWSVAVKGVISGFNSGTHIQSGSCSALQSSDSGP